MVYIPSTFHYHSPDKWVLCAQITPMRVRAVCTDHIHMCRGHHVHRSHLRVCAHTDGKGMRLSLLNFVSHFTPSVLSLNRESKCKITLILSSINKCIITWSYIFTQGNKLIKHNYYSRSPVLRCKMIVYVWNSDIISDSFHLRHSSVKWKPLSSFSKWGNLSYRELSTLRSSCIS